MKQQKQSEINNSVKRNPIFLLRITRIVCLFFQQHTNTRQRDDLQSEKVYCGNESERDYNCIY